MRHRKRKINPKKTQSAPRNRKILIWFAVALFVILQVFFTIQTATSGAQLAALEMEEEKLLKENRLLAGKLVASTSLVDIQENTEELEFSKPENLLYVDIGEFVAKAP
jgi:hypothetical protein